MILLSREDLIKTLSVILSFGYESKFFSKVVEKRIAKSPYFIAVEADNDETILYSDVQKTLASIFYDADTSKYKYNLYAWCVWVSELYLIIQEKTKMTFEAIFMYLSLDDGLKIFPVYHEMDFSQAVALFEERLKKHSVLYHAMKRRGISVSELAKVSGLSYSMISALRNRKKNIGRVAADNFLKIATYLGTRPETLLCDMSCLLF